MAYSKKIEDIFTEFFVSFFLGGIIKYKGDE